MKMADAMLAYARKAEECLDDDIVFDYSIKDAKVICKAVYEIVGKPELMPNLSIVVKSLLKPRIKKLLKMMRESPQPDWIAQRVGKEHYSPEARADYRERSKPLFLLYKGGSECARMEGAYALELGRVVLSKASSK